MNQILKLFITLIIINSVSSVKLTAQENLTDACTVSESSQFDFWIGEWNGSWEDQEGNIQTATNSIKRILGGCTVEENFSTIDGSFIGRSYSVYNLKKGIWEQTWVDNSGAYMAFTGGMYGDEMILERKVEIKDGNTMIQRMVFYEIEYEKFKWRWESSTDGGKTWTLQWHINYTRK